MKKFILFLALCGTIDFASAQSERYTKAMEQAIAGIDTTQSIAGLTEMTNTFQRIADAEKSQWLPFYYAALSLVTKGYVIAGENGGMGGFAEKTDPIADQAEALLNKADELAKNNSEIYVVRKMIASLRMIADPMNRYQTQGPAAVEALEKAKSLNPANPRISMLEAQDKYYTPEQYGGSKTEAKVLLEESLKKFDSFKPESSIHPHWGKTQVVYLLSQLK